MNMLSYSFKYYLRDDGDVFDIKIFAYYLCQVTV